MADNPSWMVTERYQPMMAAGSLGQPRMSLMALAGGRPGARLVLVRAPAGSGKTTLLRAWRHESDQSIWLDATPAFDDPATLLDHLVAALRQIDPSFGSASERALFNQADHSTDRQALFRAWQRDVLRIGSSIRCFVDDYQALTTDSDGARLADDIIRYAPEQIQFVVASRGAVPSVTTRLRLEGRLAEVTFDQLALRSDEIAAILRARGVEPDHELTAVILAATSGWSTGVLVSANALVKVVPEERIHEAWAIARHPDLVAYGADELLREAPDDLIAILDLLSVVGSTDERALLSLIIDPSLRSLLPGERIDGERLARLTNRASELGLLTRVGTTIDIPSIWRPLLRERLRSRLSAEGWKAIHSTLGRTLLINGRGTEALNAYFEAEDWPAVAMTLAQCGFEWVGDGRHRFVEALLFRLPEQLRTTDARLVHLMGLCRSRGRPVEAIEILEESIRLYRAEGNRRGEYEAISMLGLLCFGQARWDQLRQVLSRAIAVANIVTDEVARNGIVAAFAARALFAGHYRMALRISNVAAKGKLGLVQRWSNDKIRMSGYTLRGDWEQVLKLGDATFAELAIRSYPPAYYSLVPHQALALAYTGQIVEARRAIAEAAIVLGEENHGRLQAYAYLVESKIEIVAGAPDRAEASAIRALASYELLDDQTGIAPAIALLAVLRWNAGDPARAGELAERSATAYESLPAIPADGLPWLVPAIGRILARTGQVDRARRVLDRFRRDYDHPDLPFVYNTILFWLADCQDALGNQTQADRLWREAWQYGAKHRVTSWYLPLDSDLMTRAIRAGIRHGAVSEYLLDQVRASYPAALTGVLAELATDPSGSVRLRSVELIGRLGGVAAFPTLRAAVKDREPAVREAAARALDRLDLRPDYQLTIQTFRQFEIRRGDQLITEREWRGAMAKRLLLRLLIAGGRPVLRESIQLALWPEAEPEAAQHNLRVTLNRLNDVLEPHRPAGAPTTFVIATTETLCFNAKSDYSWDVEEWLSLADRVDQRARSVTAGAPDDLLIRAVERYDGPLLPELPDDEWIVPLGARLADRFVSLSLRLGQQWVDAGTPSEAVLLAERLTVIEPAEESGWILLVRAQLAAGDRVGARRSYRRAIQTLKAQLDLEPGPELQQLEQQL